GIPLGHSGLREGPSLIPLGVIDPSAVATMAVQRGPGIFGPSADGLAGAIDIRSSLDAGVDGPTGSRAMSVLVNQRLSSADRGWSGGVSATGATARVRYRIGGAGSLLGDLRAGSGERSDAVQQPHTSLR
ncbi:MAG: hypothetical protein KJO18_04090, partial [Acidimicrobiia bacterium]|nr:hypothetical protein [Acidimicrobiia bacterium]